jgi:Domain of unknown function (DUF6306)
MVIDFRCNHHGHMLELLGEEQLDVTLIDRLNELLEAERAGVDTLSRLCPEARGPEMQKLFEEVRNDEAWFCAGLVRSIKTMGGTISEKKRDFAEKVMREPVKRLDALLGETLLASVGGFLEEMKTRHITNIEACERLAESLKTACYAAEVDPGYFDKDKE